MNFLDSEKLETILLKNGFEKVDNPEDADVLIVNSCSVRKHAEDRAFGYLNSLKFLKNRGKIFCLYGCTANIYGSQIIEKYPFIDVVCGPNKIRESPKILKEALNGEKIVCVGESDNPFIEDLINVGGKISASISITKGCNNFCSYCVVPFGRGRLMSRSPQSIIDEIKRLVDKGIKEIILLGQNVNEYGKDIGTDFVSLLEKIHQIDGILRIRFLTSHPKDVPEKLIFSFGDLPKLCKHFHLPLQSGSDRILKLMNRKYTVSHYLGIVEKVREVCPDITITSDIIVGFPTESEKDFLQTYKIVENVKFDELFVFKYSPRPKTSASKLPDDVAKEEKERRHRLIYNLQQKITEQINKNYIGKIVEVLVEKESYKKKGYFIGKTHNKKTVLFRKEGNVKIGDIVNVEILNSSIHFLSGRICVK